MKSEKGLFQRWLEIERATGRPMTEILDGINRAAGTAYKHNWPSVQAKRGYELERCPALVRKYMMVVVMNHEFENLGLDKKHVEHLIKCLT